ncbi:MAG: hypothetical protein ACYDA1_02820 [Vulcanimicrobiaceae bacterium]
MDDNKTAILRSIAKHIYYAIVEAHTLTIITAYVLEKLPDLNKKAIDLGASKKELAIWIFGGVRMGEDSIGLPGYYGPAIEARFHQFPAAINSPESLIPLAILAILNAANTFHHPKG